MAAEQDLRHLGIGLRFLKTADVGCFELKSSFVRPEIRKLPDYLRDRSIHTKPARCAANDDSPLEVASDMSSSATAGSFTSHSSSNSMKVLVSNEGQTCPDGPVAILLTLISVIPRV